MEKKTIVSLEGFECKTTITFKGDDWKNYRKNPILYFLDYVFSTVEFSKEEGTIVGNIKEDLFHKFILNILTYRYTSPIVDVNRNKLFEFNSGFFINLIEEYKVKDENNLFKIYEVSYSDPVYSTLMGAISVKKDKVEVYHNIKGIGEKINLSSYKEMLDDDLVLAMKSVIAVNYKLIPSHPGEIFDDEEDKFKDRNKEILKEIKKIGGIQLEKDFWTGKTRFRINREIEQQFDIDLIINSLRKLKVLLIDLERTNRKRRNIFLKNKG